MQKRLILLTAALSLAGIGLLPMLAMVNSSLHVEGAFSLRIYEALYASAQQQMPLMGHSLLLSATVSLCTTAVGIPLGLLLGKTDLPLRRALGAMLTVPLLIPPYVIAVAWSAVLGSKGLVGRILPSGASEFLSSKLFGFYGCAWVLVSAYLPMVILLTIVHVGAVNPRLEEAGRLVSPWPRVLARITLPLALPGIVFASALVFLLTFGEVGVPTYFRYPVYPLDILTRVAAFYDFGAATAAAMPMVAVTLAVLGLEYLFLHKRGIRLSATVAPKSTETPIELGRWRLLGLVLVCGFVFLTVALPLASLLVQTASPSIFIAAFTRASDSIVRSLAFALIGATLLSVLGFFCGYLVHNQERLLGRSIDALALFVFTLPGTVIGIGLISLWNTPMTNAIYGSAAIIILGYLAQYTVLPLRITSASLAHIPKSLEQAAWLCGADWFTTLGRVVVPLAQRGLIGAWLIGYVFCLRDLGISMVVYPPGSDTLPVRIFTLMANGAPSTTAALCLILIVLTLLPLGIASLWLRRAGLNGRQ